MVGLSCLLIFSVLRFPVAYLARLVSAVVVTAVCVAPASANDSQFKASYRIRLSYLPMSVATGTLKIKFTNPNRYLVDLAASGLGFAISAKSAGILREPVVIPTSAAIDTQDGKGKKRKIRIAMLGGVVRAAMLSPPERVRPDTVPLKPEHKANVVDPVSAMILPAWKGKPVLDPSQCNRTLPVFEGSERFNIILSYVRMQNVKTVTGYEGPVLVCHVRYKAVAGHRSGRKQVKYMENNETIEAWFAPVTSASALAPWRVSLGTMVGEVIIEAVRFGPTDSK
jgi:hypothetical protein